MAEPLAGCDAVSIDLWNSDCFRRRSPVLHPRDNSGAARVRWPRMWRASARHACAPIAMAPVSRGHIDRVLRRDRRANPKERVLGHIWHFPRVCGTFRERRGHCCRTPEALLERVILAASKPGELVLDPFAGTGTTPAVARRLGRRCLGVELCEGTAELTRQRLGAACGLQLAPAAGGADPGRPAEPRRTRPKPFPRSRYRSRRDSRASARIP
jgi:hypothetical protein